MWTLIALASVLLVFSISANWVQRTLLNTDEVVATTDAIVDEEDVQEQLSIFLVDQLYANVDVQAQIEQQLPDPVQPLAAPIGAAARQLANEVARRALASPEFQDLISAAIRRSHERFVGLIRDEGTYVATTGGDVTIDYGSAVADLAIRLGLDPETVSAVQGVVQDLSTNLRERLSEAQARIESLRAGLEQAQAGELSSELRERLQALDANAAQAQSRIASLEAKVEGVEDRVPDQLEGRLSDLKRLLADLDARLTGLEQRSDAVLDDPSQANVDALDDSLATLEARIATLLDRQVVQNPGEFVVIESDQLDGVQSLVQALRNLGFVLPLLVLLLYAAALYLAKGWRREALIRAGCGILAATVIALLARRLIGNEVTSLAGSEAVEPAVASVWDILSGGLRERALFVLVIGLGFVAGGLLAGPGRHATAVRSFLAPYLRDHPVAVYSVVAGLFLLWLAFIPGIDNLGQVLVIVLLAALAAVGVEALRRQTAREFPSGSSGS